MLKKQPKTEMEYWQAIEGLGGYIWQTNHDMAHGRISDKSGEVDKSLIEARGLQKSLVDEIETKFGVIQPKNCPKVLTGQMPPPAPTGKIYYWDWYNKIKRRFYQAEYNGLICSACPFSHGVDQMISLGGVIPCEPFRGMMYRLRAPHLCGMTGFSDLWTRNELRKQVKAKVSASGLKHFLRTERRLRNKFKRQQLAKQPRWLRQ